MILACLYRVDTWCHTVHSYQVSIINVLQQASYRDCGRQIAGRPLPIVVGLALVLVVLPWPVPKQIIKSPAVIEPVMPRKVEHMHSWLGFAVH